MARGVNKVILIGHLGADPETRYMPDGKAVANIRIATSNTWRDKQTGDQREHTEWHSVVLYGRLGEIAAEFLRKGSQVYVEGQLRTRKWQDKDGNDRYTTEIVARDMQMLGGPRGNSTSSTGTAPAQPPGDDTGMPPEDDDTLWDIVKEGGDVEEFARQLVQVGHVEHSKMAKLNEKFANRRRGDDAGELTPRLDETP